MKAKNPFTTGVLSIERVMAAAEESLFGMSDEGFRIICGAETFIEPDARGVHCEECERNGVYGAEEILFTWAA